MANLPNRSFTPVVHVENEKQGLRNAETALTRGGHGVWLISHDHLDARELLGVVRAVRNRFRAAWIGVNFLDVGDPADGFALLGAAARGGTAVDGYWVDNPRIAGANPGESGQDEIAAARRESGWKGAYYAGVAFKEQDQPADIPAAVRAARPYADVLVTSGPGTGIPATLEKVRSVVGAAAGRPVGLASGVDEKNLAGYARAGVARFLVATSLSVTDASGNRDDANLDPEKVARMRRLLDAAG